MTESLRELEGFPTEIPFRKQLKEPTSGQQKQPQGNTKVRLLRSHLDRLVQ